MFCTKCGKEVFDEAVICPGCGCLLQQNKKVKTPKTTDGQERGVFNILTRVLLLVSFGLACAAFLFIICSLANPDTFEYCSYEKMSSYSTHYHSISISFYPNFGLMLTAFIVAAVAVVTAIPSFVFACIKQEKEWLKMFSLMNLIATVIILTTTIIALSL